MDPHHTQKLLWEHVNPLDLVNRTKYHIFHQLLMEQWLDINHIWKLYTQKFDRLKMNKWLG